MTRLAAPTDSLPSHTGAGDSPTLAFRSSGWKTFWAVSGVCIGLLVSLQIVLRLDVDYGF